MNKIDIEPELTHLRIDWKPKKRGREEKKNNKWQNKQTADCYCDFDVMNVGRKITTNIVVNRL